MKESNSPACPGCGATQFSSPLTIKSQPVVLNYRFQSAPMAQEVRRADIDLVQCQDCALVFNRTFQPDLTPYDERYENSQCYSPAFLSHLERVADRLISRYHLRQKEILELGCGKGFFLKQLCERGGNHGAGYDTSYEGLDHLDKPSVNFFRRYVTASQIVSPFDAVICRHVIEHVPRIGEFLEELARIARACGRPVVYLETPSFEWIVRHGCFWDLVYEHCNYFSHPGLAYLCRRAGFEILDHRPEFNEQYQALELRAQPQPEPVHDLPGIHPSANLDTLGQTVRKSHLHLVQRLKSCQAEKGWAIWGAGAKGVALVNQIDYPPPAFVIDSNPAKQGGTIPGSSVPVVSPEDGRILHLAAILIANPAYFEEIKGVLQPRGYNRALIST